jgi:transcriptional regulator with XRE-family HTH domain
MITGRLMRELREARGVSLAGSAERSGWSKGHLSRVERGITKPSLSLVRWYDGNFGAEDALVRQFLQLEEATREDRLRTLQHTRPGHPALTAAGGTVPADFDPRDLCLLVTETVPDGTSVRAGSGFAKTWTVRNGGPARWARRWLTRQGGTPGVPGWLDSPRQVLVPDTEPGQQVTIAVSMRASSWPGSSVAYFKMTDAAGRLYFPATDDCPLYCSVNVAG